MAKNDSENLPLTSIREWEFGKIRQRLCFTMPEIHAQMKKNAVTSGIRVPRYYRALYEYEKSFLKAAPLKVIQALLDLAGEKPFQEAAQMVRKEYERMMNPNKPSA